MRWTLDGPQIVSNVLRRRGIVCGTVMFGLCAVVNSFDSAAAVSTNAFLMDGISVRFGAAAPANLSPQVINGIGFIEVSLPNGTQAYTRDGQMRIAADGRVMTSSGYVVNGWPSIPPNAMAFTISPDGTATISGPFGTTNFRVQLVRFRSPEMLLTIGTNLFVETVASGPPETGNPRENGYGEIGPDYLALPNSVGLVIKGASARTVPPQLQIEASTDLKTWTVLALGQPSTDGTLYVRDLPPPSSRVRFYRAKTP